MYIAAESIFSRLGFPSPPEVANILMPARLKGFGLIRDNLQYYENYEKIMEPARSTASTSPI